MLTPEATAKMNAHDALPDNGQRIRCFLKNGDIVTGTVALVWLALDTPCINLQFHNTVLQVFPGLGDRWEAVTDGACNKGPGCSCNCEPRPYAGCKNANHCGSHSAGCHVNC